VCGATCALVFIDCCSFLTYYIASHHQQQQQRQPLSAFSNALQTRFADTVRLYKLILWIQYVSKKVSITIFWCAQKPAGLASSAAITNTTAASDCYKQRFLQSSPIRNVTRPSGESKTTNIVNFKNSS